MRYALARRADDAARILVEHIENGVQQAVMSGPLATGDGRVR